MKNRNLKLGYLLVALNNAFFWYAPWLLYLFQYIDISQAAILQATGLVASVIAEVPTGALSDLIGKKKTLAFGFLLTAIGEIIMAFSTDFQVFLALWILLNIGYSFYSGTMEAFMYDTLASTNDEDEYPRVVSRMQVALNASIAFASISGGIMFRLSPGLPWLATGVVKLIGFLITFKLTEPPVDTDTFSVKNFLTQTKKGFSHLLKRSMLKYTSLLLIFGSFMAVAYEILDDVAVVDWGFNEIEIGLIYAAATLIAIPASYLYEFFAKRLSPIKMVVIASLLLTGNYLFSPWITAPLWVVIFLSRVFYSPIRGSAVSEVLNKHTTSNIRATTLSTYELMRKMPYVLLAGTMGIMMENLGVRWFSHYFALTLLGLVCLYLGVIGTTKLFKNIAPE